MKKLKIAVKEPIKAEENLLNYKRWFNGMKIFSSVKVDPKKIDK